MHSATLIAIFWLPVTLVMAQITLAPAIVIGSDPFDPFGNAAQPQPLVAEPPLPPMPFRSHAGQPLANASLPPYVKAEPGNLTLFADIDHPEAQASPCI